MAFRHPWSQQVLAVLPDELTGAAVSADDPLWERVETTGETGVACPQ